ncbi:hypothetical protein Tco_0925508, partial [Tanacetum coccineum]
MSSSKFTETHNLVAFLEKPVESEGFEQIIDFLNASSINYALTINPTIYHSCVQQFWEAAKVKTVNDEVHIQALIDKKRVVITEATIRRDLKLRDADGIACLPNETIFAELARMGYDKITQKLTFYKAFFSPKWKFMIHTILQCLSAKSTAWNEFSSTMETAIICLATAQKFNFSGYIVESDMSHHKKAFAAPSLTKKRLALILIKTIYPQPNQKSKRKQRREVEVFSTVPTTSSNDPPHSGEDSMQLNELMLFSTILQQQVLDLQKAKDAQREEITTLKKRVKKLEGRRKKRSSGLRRLKKVGMGAKVVSSDDEGLGEEVIVDEAQKVVEEVIEDITTARKEEAISTAPQVTTAPIASVELTLAQTLVEIRNAAKPKVK